MSGAKRVREEAGGGAAGSEGGRGAEGKAALAASPFASLSHDDVLLALSVTVHTLCRLERTSEAGVASARAVCAAWAARLPL